MPNTQNPNQSENENPSIKATGGDQNRQGEQKSGQQGGQQGGQGQYGSGRPQHDDEEKNRQNAPGNKPQGR